MSDRIYVFRSNNSDYESVFKEGICFFDQKLDMSKSFFRVDDNLYEFLASVDKNIAVYIIKIPDDYFCVTQEDGYKVLPYPMLYEREAYDPSRKLLDIFPVLVPSLISCMYKGSAGAFGNPNYNVQYNPNGLKFTKEQLEVIQKNVSFMYSEMAKRNDMDIEMLYDLDRSNKTWDNLMKEYEVSGDIQPFAGRELTDVTFDSRKQKKKALANKKKKKKHNYEE